MAVRSRRTKGSGSIQRRGHRWYPVVNMKDPLTGKRTRKSGGGFPTKIAAQAMLSKLLAEGGEYRSTRGFTLQCLLDEYIASCAARHCSPTTIAGYKVIASRLEAISCSEVEKLRADQIEAFYTQLLDGKLSPTTVAHTHGLLTAAFRWAQKKGRTNQNPMLRVDPPRRKRSDAMSLQIDEANILLSAIRGHRLEAPMTFALATGMRRGEVAGLRWGSVDLSREVIIVRESRAWADKKLSQKATKSDRVREIPISSLAYGALKLSQEQRQGNALKRSDFVFTDELGEPLHPNALTDAFRRLAVRIGLPTQRLHDLRHTAATLMLAAGSDLITVQQILGHSAASTTANIYGHSLRGHKEQAVRTIDTALSRRPDAS